jgi:hypothetical protein
VTTRSVAFKMFRLSEHEQRQAIVELSLDEDGDHNLRDYEFALAAVRRAAERELLKELDTKIDNLLEAHGS